MTTPVLPVRTLTRDTLLESTLRALAVFAYILLAAAVCNRWRLAPERLTLLALLAIETFTLGLMVFAREAKFRDLSPAAALSTVLATFYFVFLNFAPGRHVVPEFVAVAVQVAGMAWQVWSKYTLGRSFGLLPAHRGIVTSGPYAFVRHPIYFGYLVAHVGFLGANLSLRNALVIVGLYSLQYVRMAFEERLLAAQSTEYQEYQQRVRRRLVPWIL